MATRFGRATTSSWSPLAILALLLAIPALIIAIVAQSKPFPNRIKTINSIDPVISTLDFGINAGSGISITPGVNGITVASNSSGVTSVGLSLPASVFSVTGSPVTGIGTLTGSFIVQSANTFLRGPTSGPPALPTFDIITASDISCSSAIGTSCVPVILDNFATPSKFPTSPGTEGIWYGDNAKAGLSTSSSIGIGNGGIIAATDSIAIGQAVISNGTGAISIGENSGAFGNTAVSVGSQTIARGLSSVAIGFQSVADRLWSVAIGYGAQTTGANFGIAMGWAASVTRQENIAIGPVSAATGTVGGAIAIGSNPTSTGTKSIAIGTGADSTSDGAVTLGGDSIASGGASLALGSIASAVGAYSIAIGASTYAPYDNTIAIGQLAMAGDIMTGSSPLAIKVGTAGNNPIVTEVPAATDTTLIIMINGNRYKIPMIAFP